MRPFPATGRRRIGPRPFCAIVCAALAPLIAGCAGAVIGAGATAGTAAMEERGLDGAAADTAIRARINELWADGDERMWRKVGLQVRDGRALLTGAVDRPEMRLDAVRLAWQADGVREVINEIRIAESAGLAGFARDSWITAELRTELLLDKNVASINYSIETVRGRIYLLGIAQDRRELDRVINHARNLAYVKKVISYVRVKPPQS